MLASGASLMSRCRTIRRVISPDQTSVAERSPYLQEWSILLDDGRRIALDGLILLGRNPQPQAGEEDAQLIKIADETRTVSKSHLAVGLDAGGVYVVDRGSTNGSTVSTTNGMSTRAARRAKWSGLVRARSYPSVTTGLRSRVAANCCLPR